MQIVLETEVTNKGALSLYERLDFSRDKRLQAYYMNGGDAYRLKLWLSPPVMPILFGPMDDAVVVNPVPGVVDSTVASITSGAAEEAHVVPVAASMPAPAIDSAAISNAQVAMDH